MHYLDPTAQVAPPSSSGAHSNYDTQHAGLSLSIENESRKLTGVMAEYEHYLRSGGRSDFNEWASKRFGDINVPHIVLPKSLYLQRTRRSHAPIRDILNSTSPLASEDVALVEAAVLQLQVFDESLGDKRAEPIQSRQVSTPVPQENPREVMVVQNNIPECKDELASMEIVSSSSSESCIVRSQKKMVDVVSISQHAAFEIPSFSIITAGRVSSRIGAYALVMEIVTQSHYNNVPITCSARILSVRKEMVETYAFVGRCVLNQLLHQFTLDGHGRVTPRRVAQEVLRLRPLLREAVMDTLVGARLWCANMGVLLWMCGNDAGKSIYDLYYMPLVPRTNRVPDDPICTLKELQEIHSTLQRYYERKSTALTDDEYFAIRQIAEIGMAVCRVYWANNPGSRVKHKFIGMCSGDMSKRALQYCEAWEDLVEFMLDKFAPDDLLRPCDIQSVVTFMENNKCAPFMDNFFIRYAESFEYAFSQDLEATHGEHILQRPQHFTQWDGVAAFIQQYDDILDPVKSSKLPQVVLYAGVPLLESVWVVGNFFAQLSIEGSFECGNIPINDAAFERAHNKIRVEIMRVFIYWPNITREELLKEILKYASRPEFAEDLRMIVAALLPWTAVAILFVRAGAGNLADKYPAVCEPVATRPVQSYEPNSEFDYFVRHAISGAS